MLDFLVKIIASFHGNIKSKLLVWGAYSYVMWDPTHKSSLGDATEV